MKTLKDQAFAKRLERAKQLSGQGYRALADLWGVPHHSDLRRLIADGLAPADQALRRRMEAWCDDVFEQHNAPSGHVAGITEDPTADEEIAELFARLDAKLKPLGMRSDVRRL